MREGESLNDVAETIPLHLGVDSSKSAKSIAAKDLELQLQVRSTEISEAQLRTAWAAVIASLIGTALLAWTLLETRSQNKKANEAFASANSHTQRALGIAEDANDISKRQLESASRAWITSDGLEPRLYLDAHGKLKEITLQFPITNTGERPAIGIQVFMADSITNGTIDILDDLNQPPTVLGPKRHSYVGGHLKLTPEQLQATRDGKPLLVRFDIRYFDGHSEKERRSTFTHEIRYIGGTSVMEAELNSLGRFIISVPGSEVDVMT